MSCFSASSFSKKKAVKNIGASTPLSSTDNNDASRTRNGVHIESCSFRLSGHAYEIKRVAPNEQQALLLNEKTKIVSNDGSTSIQSKTKEPYKKYSCIQSPKKKASSRDPSAIIVHSPTIKSSSSRSVKSSGASVSSRRSNAISTSSSWGTVGNGKKKAVQNNLSRLNATRQANDDSRNTLSAQEESAELKKSNSLKTPTEATPIVQGRPRRQSYGDEPAGLDFLPASTKLASSGTRQVTTVYSDHKITSPKTLSDGDVFGESTNRRSSRKPRTRKTLETEDPAPYYVSLRKSNSALDDASSLGCESIRTNKYNKTYPVEKGSKKNIDPLGLFPEDMSGTEDEDVQAEEEFARMCKEGTRAAVNMVFTASDMLGIDGIIEDGFGAGGFVDDNGSFFEGDEGDDEYSDNESSDDDDNTGIVSYGVTNDFVGRQRYRREEPTTSRHRYRDHATAKYNHRMNDWSNAMFSTANEEIFAGEAKSARPKKEERATSHILKRLETTKRGQSRRNVASNRQKEGTRQVMNRDFDDMSDTEDPFSTLGLTPFIPNW